MEKSIAVKGANKKTAANEESTGIDPENPRKNLNKKTAHLNAEEKVIRCDTDSGDRPINLLQLFSLIDKVVENNSNGLKEKVPTLKVKPPNTVRVEFQQETRSELLITECKGGDFCLEVRRPTSRGFRVYDLSNIRQKVAARKNKKDLPLLTLSNSVGIVNFV